MTLEGSPAAEFRAVTRRFGEVTAVRDISFSIARGEFFSMLGPSGCGKTTLLRLLAGFERPDAGDILLLGSVVNDRRPYERPLGMVFQSYALFPHLTVEGNVAFGLEERRVAKDEIRRRVGRALELVRLDPAGFGRRLPAQLSGGQRQRVALARALVLEPQILLLDEPLGAIDLKLRKEMQLELKTLHRELGTTFVYVTHDQEEALTMSDRIAVMDRARVVQLGTPADIYENPRTEFVAGFIGEANLLSGTAERRDGGSLDVRLDSGLRVRVTADAGIPAQAGSPIRVAIRPEWLDLFPPDAVPAGENALTGVIRDIVYLGETMHLVVALAHGGTWKVAVRNEGQLTNPLPWRTGDPVAVAWKPEDCQVLEGE